MAGMFADNIIKGKLKSGGKMLLLAASLLLGSHCFISKDGAAWSVIASLPTNNLYLLETLCFPARLI